MNYASMLGLQMSPDNLPTPGFVLFALLFVLLVRFLRILSCNEKPELTCGKGKPNSRPKNDSIICLREVLEKCEILQEKYAPPMIWGRNGHLQTAVYGILGHSSLKRSYDYRHYVKLDTDKITTVTFDVFEPTKKHRCEGDYTLVLCPGIANSSESNYIRTCVHYAQENGYRCAVLNHLGALADVRLTSDHIFSYGGTDEIHAMFKLLCTNYPSTIFIAVGFSMGGNITTRFLSELDENLQKRVLLGISVCQGYSATASASFYHDWECGRRIYNYVITENMKRLLRRNYERAIVPHAKNATIDEKRVWSCTSILALDENYSRRVHGFDSVENYYNWSSCLSRIPRIEIPIIFVNAIDDPLIPMPLWRPVQEICRDGSTGHAFLLVKHGGHLGFLEGGALKPNSVSWLDRLIVEVANSATLSS